jgi:hypothetical protein
VTDLPGRLESLAARLPGVPWDAKNQAAVHTWYGRVFGGRVAVAHYHRRLRDKRVAERWPKVEIVLEGHDVP